MGACWESLPGQDFGLARNYNFKNWMKAAQVLMARNRMCLHLGGMLQGTASPCLLQGLSACTGAQRAGVRLLQHGEERHGYQGVPAGCGETARVCTAGALEHSGI